MRTLGPAATLLILCASSGSSATSDGTAAAVEILRAELAALRAVVEQQAAKIAKLEQSPPSQEPEARRQLTQDSATEEATATINLGSANIRSRNSYLDLSAASGTGMRIAAGGNVGVGVAAPQAKLHVEGGYLAVGPTHPSSAGSPEGGEVWLLKPRDGSTDWVMDNYNNHLRIITCPDITTPTTGCEIKVSINANGNVGIGAVAGDDIMNAPHRLTVGGTMGATDVRVGQGGNGIVARHFGGSVSMASAGTTYYLYRSVHTGSAFISVAVRPNTGHGGWFATYIFNGGYGSVVLTKLGEHAYTNPSNLVSGCSVQYDNSGQSRHHVLTVRCSTIHSGGAVATFSATGAMSAEAHLCSSPTSC